ncbi:MAG: hypothetical protein NTX53_17315 [candidate division WOR-3 bacterium]|nr:hypothetical protein [candidate division WOR-3 bacterium]
MPQEYLDLRGWQAAGQHLARYRITSLLPYAFVEVIFIDGKNRVLGLKRNITPFHMAGAWRGIRTRTLPAGAIAAEAASTDNSVVLETKETYAG